MSRPLAHRFPSPRHASRSFWQVRFAFVLTAIVLWLSHASSAMADTELVLNGKVIAGTCVVSAQPVVWSDISAADIPVAEGRVETSAERFDIAMTGCAGVKSAKLTFGKAADQHPVHTDTFRNTSLNPAPHLSIWIQRANPAGNCPTNGSTQGPGTTLTTLINGNDVTLPFCATYWNVDGEAVTAGEVYASMVVAIAYQ